MNSVTFRELWEVAMILEPGSARNAGERMTQEVLQILADNVRDTERAVASGYDIVTLDVDFHDIIADSADNKALELARKPISLLFYPSLRKLFAHPSAVAAPGRLVDAHKMILEALRDRDAERAESAMRRHLADFRRGYAHCGIDMNQSLIGAQDHAGP